MLDPIAAWAIIVGTVAGACYGIRRAMRDPIPPSRTQLLARQSGFGVEFDPHGHWLERRQIRSPYLLKNGPRSRARNLFYGKLKGFQSFASFEYLLYPWGEARTAVAAFEFSAPTLPEFRLTPRETLRLERFDIDIPNVLEWTTREVRFESDPAFSRQYCLRAADVAKTAVLFRREVRAAFVRDTDWSAEGQGPWLLMYRYRLEPGDEASAFFDRARRIAVRFRA